MEAWVGNAASAATAAIIAVLGAIGVERLRSKPAGVTAVAAQEAAGAHVQLAINTGFEILTKAMHLEMDGMREELAEARQEITSLKQTIDEQAGELRNLSQHIVSLENNLRANGLEVPERPFVAAVLPFEPPEGSTIQKLNQHVKPRKKN